MSRLSRISKAQAKELVAIAALSGMTVNDWIMKYFAPRAHPSLGPEAKPSTKRSLGK